MTNTKGPQLIALIALVLITTQTFALRKMLAVDPNNTFGNHALGIAYAQTGNKEGAMQQYYILQSINPRLAADLLRQILK